MRENTETTTILTGTSDGPAPADMANIRMPQLHLPFPAHDPNPAHPGAQAALDAWLDASQICQSPASRSSLQHARIPLITALAYPDADPAALELLVQWVALTFLIDDNFDDGPDGQDPTRCANALATFLPLLDGSPPGSTASARTFAATLQDLTAGRSAAFDRVLRSDISAWLWSYYQSVVDQGSGRIPTVTAYRRQRAVTSGVYSLLDVVEIAAGIDLPETVRHFSSFQDLRDAASEYVGLHNDLWSLELDKAAGAFHNVVLLVQHHDRLPLQEAVDAVNAMLNHCVQRMQDAERDLTSQLDAARITGTTREDVLTCAAGYRKFVRGCFDYPSQTSRYTAPPAAGRETPPHRLVAPTPIR